MPTGFDIPAHIPEPTSVEFGGFDIPRVVLSGGVPRVILGSVFIVLILLGVLGCA